VQLKIENLTSQLSPDFYLKNISFELEAGRILTLLGRSGSGKTSLLRCLAGLRSFSATTCSIPLPFGMVFQSCNLFEHLSLSDNVKIALIKTQNKTKAEAQTICDQVLEQVQLRHRSSARPHELSGGEQQRGAIARTLALNPKVIFYDEPTSALDPELSIEVYDLMNRLKERGIIQIVVSHETCVVDRISDLIGYMREGELKCVGTPEKIQSQLNGMEPEEKRYLQLFF
jgi:ABC-type polar amino acid transport system ATPase subunit